jgi:MipA family protein
MRITTRAATAAATAVLLAAPAVAQDPPEEKRRVRVGLGAQLVPSYPGADKITVAPLVTVAVARGDNAFVFSAPDDSFGPAIVTSKSGLSFGPAISLQGERKNSDVGAPLGKVKTTVEIGAFVQQQVGESFRVRAELRKGLGGHGGWSGDVGADFIIRDRDAYVFSVGPRVRLSDGDYHRAYYGVTPAQSAATGLAVYRPDGGVEAIGATAGALYQLSRRWGVSGYARYDRLVSDAADSPVVRQFGSRDQFSGGLALTYTFGG